MRLTTKGRFAVTAMVDLAMRQNRGPVTLAAISERQHISLSYLEQLFGKLRRSKLVSSVRGPGGGYNLAQAAPQITVADIVTAVDKDSERLVISRLWTRPSMRRNAAGARTATKRGAA